MRKLQDMYNRISLITTISVIIVAGFVYYCTISYILTSQVDKDLLVEENEIFDYVALNHKLPQVFRSEDLKIRFKPLNGKPPLRRIADVKYWDDKDHKKESGRSLVSSVKVGGQLYQITIIESKVETEDLIRLIFLITLGIIFILLVVLLIINRVLMRNLWQPFYQMLRQIKLFNLADHSSITELDTEIEEFHDMNLEVTAMSERVQGDYRTLKNFVENAAHELMTPLAVMNSKLDTLVQDRNLTDQQGALIGEVYQTVSKMRKLNKSMLLLARIENKLMPDQEEIELSGQIEEKLAEFQELLYAKGLSLSIQLQPCYISINRDLLTILLNNLISNAIRHNYSAGKLTFELTREKLSIGNTGSREQLNPDVVFQRFYKSPESEGAGLGLTLVNEICESYNFTLQYDYRNHQHVFTIFFQGL